MGGNKLDFFPCDCKFIFHNSEYFWELQGRKSEMWDINSDLYVWEVRITFILFYGDIVFDFPVKFEFISHNSEFFS